MSEPLTRDDERADVERLVRQSLDAGSKQFYHREDVSLLCEQLDAERARAEKAEKALAAALNAAQSRLNDWRRAEAEHDVTKAALDAAVKERDAWRVVYDFWWREGPCSLADKDAHARAIPR